MMTLFLGCEKPSKKGSADVSSGRADQTGGGPLERATLAGGCFWCMEAPFETLEGVVSVEAGYAGGREPNPTYHQVAAGTTGHVEAVQITFDPAVISYDRLLAVFWRQIDPTDEGGSFVDRGPQYRSVIFYHGESQRQAAEASRQALAESGRYPKPIVTEIRPFTAFYPAEEYHQDYHRKNPVRYKLYRTGSGRDQHLEAVWAKDGDGAFKEKPSEQPGQSFVRPSDSELKIRLTPMQFSVTRGNGTEPPFHNAYWDQKEPGIYVDVVSGEPLFSSRDKFDSGTGWPSFTQPIKPDALVEKPDRSLFTPRVEVRSSLADSHLGHVFNDGPPPTGRRYCINSAALRFVPAAELEARGYGAFFKDIK